MSAERREFPTLEVASAITGVALCSTTIARMHEITGHLAGHPVWTHELGNRRMMQRIAEHAYEQFPNMPTRQEVEQDKDAAAAKALSAYGQKLSVREGTLERDCDPVSSLGEIMNKHEAPMSADILKFQPPAKPRRSPGTKRMLGICEASEAIYQAYERLPLPLLRQHRDWLNGTIERLESDDG